MKRVFLIVLDSVGIGEMPDADEYGDAGSNTIAAAASSPSFSMPNMQKLGFFNIDGVDCREGSAAPAGAFARLTERSKGKDTTVFRKSCWMNLKKRREERFSAINHIQEPR